MLQRRSYRCRLYPTVAQATHMRQIAGICRLVRNLVLEQRKVWGERHKITAIGQCNELKALKADFPWIAEAPHHCLQQAIRDIDKAFSAFFAGRGGFPRRLRLRTH